MSTPSTPEAPPVRPLPPPRHRQEAGRNVVGARVRQARRDRTPRLTQADLVALLGAYGVPLGVPGLSKIEAGRRPVYDYEVRALSEALVVTADWLLGVEEP